MSFIGIKVPYVVLEPTASADVPNGALYLDSDNANAPTIKSTGGSSNPIGSSESSALFIKQMQAGGSFDINKPLSKRPDGKVVLADADATNGQQVIGFSLQISTGDGDLVNVLTIGANIAGALTSLGFAPGDTVYLSETGNGSTVYTNDPNSFTGNNDSIVQVGVADCAAGAASTTVTDLIAFAQILLRP